MGGCYDDSDREDEDSDEYGFGALEEADDESDSSEEDDESDSSEEEEEEEEEEENKVEEEGIKTTEEAARVLIVKQNQLPASTPSSFAGRSSMKGTARGTMPRTLSVRFGESEKGTDLELQKEDESETNKDDHAGEAPTTEEVDQANPGDTGPVQQGNTRQTPENAISNASAAGTLGPIIQVGRKQGGKIRQPSARGDRRTSGPIAVAGVVVPQRVIVVHDDQRAAGPIAMAGAVLQRQPGARRDRRTSGPISVATVLLPIKPLVAKQDSSNGPSGSTANRKLSIPRLPEEAG